MPECAVYMTRDDLEKYFFPFVKKDGVTETDNDTNALIRLCITQGINEFWGAWHWTFAEKEATLATVSGTNDYALPDDFDSMLTIRENESISGRSLSYVPRESFDRNAPRPDQMQNGIPSAYTIFNDDSDDVKHRIKFFPVPDGAYTMYLWYRMTPQDISKIPDKFIAAVKNIIWRHVVSPSSAAYGNVAAAAGRSLADAIKMDRRNTMRKVEFVYSAAEPMRRYLWESDAVWER